MNENNHTSLSSFDRMRSTLMRAAEIRESEQQQIFDALDEIHARMSPLESLGAVRKRLSELPDRTEVSVLAERLDEALAKLEAQDGSIAELNRAVDGLVDRLAKPFAQLDGRLDGVAGRFDGVAGRMDGLEDKLAHIHKRLDDLGGRFDKTDVRLDALPSAVTGPVRDRLEAVEAALRSRLDEVDEGMHEHLDGTREAVQRTVSETTDGLQSAVTETRDSVHGKLDDTRDGVHGKLDELAKRPAVDPTGQLDSLGQRLEQLTSRLDEVSARLDTVEDGFTARIGDLNGTVQQGLNRIDGSLGDRPVSDDVASLVRRANEESERRQAGHLDEAMATFAELIIGGSQPAPPPPTTLPRAPRRGRSKSAAKNSKPALDDGDELAAEGA